MRHPIANYSKERTAIQALLNDECEQRIMLLRGPSGSGKTTLVDEALAGLPNGKTARIQLRTCAVGVEEILQRCGEELSSQTTSPGIEGNVQFGWRNSIKNINIYRGEPSREALTKAFFDHVKRLDHEVLIAFDTFEQGTGEVRAWISGPFLARVVHFRQVRVVVAGRKVPNERNLEWGRHSQTLHLTGVPDPDEWLAVVSEMGRRYPDGYPDGRTYMKGICDAFKGCPADIINSITGLPRGNGLP